MLPPPLRPVATKWSQWSLVLGREGWQQSRDGWMEGRMDVLYCNCLLLPPNCTGLGC